jgi:hypothetical protein
MEEEEDIESMFIRFKSLIDELKAIDGNYSETDLILKILTSLPQKWNQVITRIEETENIDKMCLLSLISYLKIYEEALKAKEDEKVIFVKKEENSGKGPMTKDEVIDLVARMVKMNIENKVESSKSESSTFSSTSSQAKEEP